ncbi:hypothetical protein ABZZ20_19145 [Streptomyces sp. NPDC006430]|uniref:hypothetical protein n=1 Tax=Streptomyces sp. NPDC006430 TaxID=3154299 RepID=UPI0033B568E2
MVRLRAAYEAAAAQPLTTLTQRGHMLPRPALHRHTATLRRTLPDLADQILAEPGWPALAATLADAATARRDPAALLAEAAVQRELATATSVSEVLVWRLRHLAELSLQPAPRQPAPTPVRDRAARSTQQRRTR